MLFTLCTQEAVGIILPSVLLPFPPPPLLLVGERKLEHTTLNCGLWIGEGHWQPQVKVMQIQIHLGAVQCTSCHCILMKGKIAFQPSCTVSSVDDQQFIFDEVWPMMSMGCAHHHLKTWQWPHSRLECSGLQSVKAIWRQATCYPERFVAPVLPSGGLLVHKLTTRNF